MKFYIFISIIMATLLNLGCSHDKPKKEVQINKYFVKGDPAQVYAGATLDTKLPFDRDDVENYEVYDLASLVVFNEREDSYAEKERKKKERNSFIVNTNRINAISRSANDFKFRLDFAYLLELSNDYMSIKFDPGANLKGSTIVTSIKIGDFKTVPKLIHFSSTENLDQFSFLFEIDTKSEGKTVVSLVFEKSKFEKEPLQGSYKYKYLFGDGKKIGWDQSKVLELNICGANTISHESAITSAINDWQVHLKNRLDIHYKNLYQFPPFSDLNTHCIQMIDAYLTIDEPGRANPGLAITLQSKKSAKLNDSDIFFIKSEINKLGAVSIDQISTYLYKTARHELGHLLGLAHQFDGTRSIMSYEKEDIEIYDYDIEAIQELYPLCYGKENGFDCESI